MATEIVMPRLSDTMETGTIAKWLKQEGDSVKNGEVIAEIETDKANMELESYATGILARISVREGQSAGVGEPIAVVAKDESEAQSLKGQGGAPSGSEQKEAGGDATQQKPATGGADTPGRKPEPAPREQQPAAPVEARSGEDGQRQEQPVSPNGGRASGERVKASPLARRMAAEHGLELGAINSTGPGGRITKEDIQAFMRSGAQAPAASAPEREPAQPPQPAPQEQRQPSAAGGPRGAQPVEMTRMQQTIARRMTEARFSAPDFVLTAEVDMTEARSLLHTISNVEGAPKVGPNDFLIKAVAAALKQHPEVNSGWENGGIMRYGRVNIGNAVAIPGGLVVPVILDADKKTLGEVATESKGLIEKARNNKLAPGDYEGGTFSISNLGMYGIDQFTPVINVPEACILGVGSITPRPVVVDGEVVVRDRMRITLSCDHRVINGAQGAEFLQTLRRFLENPMLVVL